MLKAVLGFSRAFTTVKAGGSRHFQRRKYAQAGFTVFVSHIICFYFENPKHFCDFMFCVFIIITHHANMKDDKLLNKYTW